MKPKDSILHLGKPRRLKSSAHFHRWAFLVEVREQVLQHLKTGAFDQEWVWQLHKQVLLGFDCGYSYFTTLELQSTKNMWSFLNRVLGLSDRAISEATAGRKYARVTVTKWRLRGLEPTQLLPLFVHLRELQKLKEEQAGHFASRWAELTMLNFFLNAKSKDLPG